MTDYKDREQEHVTRMKTARLGQDKNLIVYEKWTLYNVFVSSMMQVVDDNGVSLTGEIVAEHNF